ncbi:MAG: FtsW/RodA/SpoVE family cell cycle protein [Phycisphaerales bacterium]
MSRTGYTGTSLYSGTDSRMRLGLRLATPAWLCVIAAALLSLVGIAAIGTTRPELASKQLVFLAVGVAAAACAAVVPPRMLRNLSWVFLLLAVAALVFVLLPFVPKSLVTPRNGARSWINLGAADFQPSEVAKVAFILCIAQWYSLQGSPRTLGALVVPGGIAAVLVGLIVLEPDLGSALLFAPTLAAMTIVAGMRIRYLLLALLAAALLAPLAYFVVLKPYQQARIDAIVAQIRGDDRFESTIGFQGWRAMRLVGAGGLAGHSREEARALIEFNRLPEEHNDMVFAVVVCRFGLLGAALVLGCHALFAAGAFSMAMLARDGFTKLVAVGIGSLLFAQMTVNIGMTIGLLPITGVTLPFTSYGGSSLLSCWILTGLLVGIGIRPPTGGEKDPFDG